MTANLDSNQTAPAPACCKSRKRPALFRALGDLNPPERIELSEEVFEIREIFKHDSWAATALYQGTQGGSLVVCKFNRRSPIGPFPMAWLGKRLARREYYALQNLVEVPGIPKVSPRVYVDGVWQENAVAHEFVEGHPLRQYEVVGDEFFPTLQRILSEIHERGFAYVDLHKRENIIVHSSGLPYLIDFQISLQARPRMLWKLPPFSWTLGLFQSSDRFCLFKHVRNSRQDQISTLGLQRYLRVPWWIRVHRLVAVPFRQLRRRFLSFIKVRDPSGRSKSEEFAEHAFRDNISC